VRSAFFVSLFTLYATTAALGQVAVGQSISPQIAFNGYPPFAMKPVTGRPYSGELISESVQTLADGTHISQTMRIWKIYRDSQGPSVDDGDEHRRNYTHPGYAQHR
jgi:hypothetical protein